MPDKKGIRIKRDDYHRVLITETLPEETPIIFSNDSFYRRCHPDSRSTDPVSTLIFRRLVKGEKKPRSYTIPFQYKVRKDALSNRHLSLLHPIAQWSFVEFYEKYEKLLCYFCSFSPVSIRAPYKSASTFFYKSSWESVNKYKRTYGVQDSEIDLFSRHASSFFAYKGHNRLHKFFNSREFIQLEKRFPTMWSMDVSKCFPSIYTHSMAWATKEKVFVKDNLFDGMSATFGNEFDVTMQKANYNETNGIVIGPEISRIFAEVILQAVDLKAIGCLQDDGIKHGSDYIARRYVDDIFIFARTNEIASKVHEVYSEHLFKFNLHVNTEKTKQYKRPFFTKKSLVIREVNKLINDFFSKFLIESPSGGSIVPGDIWHEGRLIRSFVDASKAICISEEVGYDEISSYIISACCERIKRLIDVDFVETGEHLRYKKAILTILEIAFFFYTTTPAVNSSYKLCVSIVLASRFAEKHIRGHEAQIKQRIFELALDLFEESFLLNKGAGENFLHLESINILLAIGELGVDYLLPAETIRKMFFAAKSLSYLDVVSCLYYIKDIDTYSEIRKAVSKHIDRELSNLGDLQTSSAKTYLFLDAISCPYVDKSLKSKWVTKFCNDFKLGAVPSQADIYSFVGTSEQQCWFVDWKEVDLLNAIERKELKAVY